ncbi:MAG: hypothetical protein Q9169_005431 [Polycauliona sp. 2 TL-2023]
MWEKLRIDPAASPDLKPCSFDEVKGTAVFINQTYNGEEPTNINDLAGRYPGIWTVPPAVDDKTIVHVLVILSSRTIKSVHLSNPRPPL